jgi:DNA-binding NarL/FixJ family response regulator
MTLELEEFASSCNLSPRETEVLVCLTNKIIHFKDIAAHLTLSPSTVNNHFKSIFDKTGTNSKSELLAAFLRHVVSKLNHCQHLVRKPQVIVLDDEPEICEFLVDELTQRGIKAYPFSNPKEALAAISGLKIDAIVSDLRMPGMDGIQFLREIRKVHHYFPFILFVSGYREREQVDQIMDMGAVALLDKPIDVNRLFNLIMEQFIEDSHERSRYFSINEKISSVVNGKFKLDITSIGFGGVFIPLEHSASGRLDGTLQQTLDVGSLISFAFDLDDEGPAIQVTGEIVWKRSASSSTPSHAGVPDEDLPPGLGLKFIQISDTDRERVRDYVRLNRVLSFIPRGSKPARH